jgi:hypothetical protein
VNNRGLEVVEDPEGDADEEDEGASEEEAEAEMD